MFITTFIGLFIIMTKHGLPHQQFTQSFLHLPSIVLMSCFAEYFSICDLNAQDEDPLG